MFKIRIGTIAKAGTFMVRNGFYYACKLHKGQPGLVVTIFTQSPFFSKLCKLEIFLDVML